VSEEGTTDFEKALAELVQIVGALELDELELDDALKMFEKGVDNLRTANRLLEKARGEIEELIEEASGELRTIGFEPGSEEPQPG
jgi:exodeoxyribonuclease VII small subunit